MFDRYIPEVQFWLAHPEQWMIDFRWIQGGIHEETGVSLRGGWVFSFGPLSMFWVREER
ncbi:MAG: hypothetical protein GYB53_22185 [Rhodobacteraceae bacterium]|nr:hypothetical protein [Paracoccaceae bacterium]MBR9823714.1 hypothetical protein [Paracoccaceae bacterium]